MTGLNNSGVDETWSVEVLCWCALFTSVFTNNRVACGWNMTMHTYGHRVYYSIRLFWLLDQRGCLKLVFEVGEQSRG